MRIGCRVRNTAARERCGGGTKPAYLFVVERLAAGEPSSGGNPLQTARVVRTGCGARWQIFKVGLTGRRGDWGDGAAGIAGAGARFGEEGFVRPLDH